MQIIEIARRLNNGESIDRLTNIPGTAYPVKNRTPRREASLSDLPENAVSLPSLSQQQADKSLVMSAQLQYQKQAHPAGNAVIQEQDPGKIVVLPPAEPINSDRPRFTV